MAGLGLCHSNQLYTVDESMTKVTKAAAQSTFGLAPLMTMDLLVSRWMPASPAGNRVARHRPRCSGTQLAKWSSAQAGMTNMAILPSRSISRPVSFQSDTEAE